MNVSYQRKSALSAEDIPDIRDLLSTLWIRRRLFISVFMTVFVLGLVLIAVKPKIYKASALLNVGQAPLNLGEFKDVIDPGRPDDARVQTEVRVLLSPDLARKTVDVLDKSVSSDRIVHTFLSNLSAVQQPGSRVIEIAYKSNDPVRAAHAVNEHLRLYTETQKTAKERKIRELRKWFETKLADLRADLARRGEDIKAFRRREHGTFMLEALRAPAVQALKAQESTLTQQYESLRTQYGPRHPKMLALRAQMDEMSVLIQKTAETMLQSDAPAGAIGGIGANDNGKLAELDALTARQRASQKVLASFLASYETLQAQNDFISQDTAIISEASIPVRPLGPSRIMYALGMIIIAFVCAFGAVMAAQIMQTGMRHYDDVRSFGLRPMGILPFVPRGFSWGSLPLSYIAAARKICTAVFALPDMRVLMPVSALPGEGRSTLVYTFAQIMAERGQRVLIVDADIARPAITRYYKLSTQTAIAGTKQDIPHVHKITDFISVLPASAIENGVSDVGDIIKWARSSYDIVMIDGAPVLADAASNMFMPHVDGVLVLAQWMKTSRRDIEYMIEKLNQMEVPIIGTILTRVDIEKYKSAAMRTDFLATRMISA